MFNRYLGTRPKINVQFLTFRRDVFDVEPMILRVGFCFLLFISLTGCEFSFFENPGAFPPDAEYDDYPGYNPVDSEVAENLEPPKAIALEGVKLFEDIFSNPQRGDIKCGDVRVFQKFVERFLVDESGEIPKLNFLCLVKYDANDIELNWIFSKPPRDVWNLLPPIQLIDVDMGGIKYISVGLESSLRMQVLKDKIHVTTEGIKISLTKKFLEGTQYAWVPENLLHFTMDYADVSEDGDYEIKLGLPLSVPFKIRGHLKVYRQNQVYKVIM